eukprot:2440679-Alexandrium_andersonii.AAC.1
MPAFAQKRRSQTIPATPQSLRQPTCLPASLPACVLARPRTYVHAFLRPCMPVCVRACVPAIGKGLKEYAILKLLLKHENFTSRYRGFRPCE